MARLETLSAQLRRQAADIMAAEYRWLRALGGVRPRRRVGAGGREDHRGMAELGLRDKRGGRPRGGSGRPGVAGLPLVSARFAVGRLSSSELRAITRVATPEKEETLVADADHATAAQLEAVVRGFRQTRRSLDDLEPDGAEALAHRERRGVR